VPCDASERSRRGPAAAVAASRLPRLKTRQAMPTFMASISGPAEESAQLLMVLFLLTQPQRPLGLGTAAFGHFGPKDPSASAPPTARSPSATC